MTSVASTAASRSAPSAALTSQAYLFTLAPLRRWLASLPNLTPGWQENSLKTQVGAVPSCLLYGLTCENKAGYTCVYNGQQRRTQALWHRTCPRLLLTVVPLWLPTGR